MGPGTYYTIEYQIKNADGYDSDHHSQIHAKALRALGMTTNPSFGVPLVEVEISKTSGFAYWGVNIPKNRADEYVKQLWKDPRVTSVRIDGEPTTKPASEDSDSEELKAFKEKVAKVAMKYARDNSWCDEVKRALKELGIEPASSKVRVVLELDFESFDGCTLDSDSSLNEIKSFIKWDADQGDLGDAVKSVEPIKG